MSAPRIAALGSFAAFLSVLLGAFGAHALSGRIPAERLVTWETGVRWMMFHALALLAIGLGAGSLPAGARGSVSKAATAFLVGIVLFTGSLVALAVTGVRALGAVTPIGGVAFLFGWLVLGAGLLRSGPKEKS